MATAVPSAGLEEHVYLPALPAERRRHVPAELVYPCTEAVAAAVGNVDHIVVVVVG